MPCVIIFSGVVLSICFVKLHDLSVLIVIQNTLVKELIFLCFDTVNFLSSTPAGLQSRTKRNHYTNQAPLRVLYTAHLTQTLERTFWLKKMFTLVEDENKNGRNDRFTSCGLTRWLSKWKQSSSATYCPLFCYLKQSPTSNYFADPLSLGIKSWFLLFHL